MSRVHGPVEIACAIGVTEPWPAQTVPLSDSHVENGPEHAARPHLQDLHCMRCRSRINKRFYARANMQFLVDSCVFIDSFDPRSPNHADALRLLEDLLRRGLLLTMPAHGWFEVQCTLQRLVKEGKFTAPTIAGKHQYPVRLVHIDKPFIERYSSVDLPYLKAGDHIFVAIAKVNAWPLVTSDRAMTEASNQCGVQVFSPAEFMDELAARI